jgi:hypothetical protein
VKLLNEPSFIENIGDRGVRSIEDAHRYLREGPMAMYENMVSASGTARKACPWGCAASQRDNLPTLTWICLFPEFWALGSLMKRPPHVETARSSVSPALSAWSRGQCRFHPRARS